jgi:hypothetical protein
MTEQACWTIIERARAGSEDEERIAERVLELLRSASLEDIEAFERGRARLMERSYNYALWGAAYLINGGCSDDGFDYFRGWLLTQGRAVFEAALADPDSLVDVAEQDQECEDILYVGYRAYEEKAGAEIEGVNMDYSDPGESWDFDDDEEMQRRYPKLWAKFGYGGDGDEADED